MARHGRLQQGDVTLPSIESCRDHLSALYLVGLLSTGDCQQAQAHVVAAIAHAVTDPRFEPTDQPSTWRLLNAHHAAPEDRAPAAEAVKARQRIAPLSDAQRQTMALLAAGRSCDDVAVLLTVPIWQVHENLRSGKDILGAALRRSFPPDTETDTDQAAAHAEAR